MSFPPLAALFLTHFDDIKGQSIIFYASINDEALPPGRIEHTTLPSGLHTLASDFILFTHHHLPGAGLFRSRDTSASREGGPSRGRRMSTLGVVPAPPATSADMFDLSRALEEVYDRLEALDDSRFAPARSKAVELLRKVFEEHRAETSSSLDRPSTSRQTDIRDLIDGHAHPSADHPITYFPSLLSLLGPSLIPLYRSTLAGHHVLVYSQPPLGPTSAFAWCIWAMSLPPPSTSNSTRTPQTSEWVGNVGLMDLDDMKARSGGWVATTSDAIYKLHPLSYDIFLDLSSSPPTILSSSSLSSGTDPQPVTYAFSDLPLYRSLLLLSDSPPSVNVSAAGLWMMAFEMLERVWRLCVGVCEYAIGRGDVGSVGGDRAIRIDEDEGEGGEDARLLGEVDEDVLIGEERDGDEEDEAVRRGRLILGQLQHNSYHLHGRLRGVAKGSVGERLTEAQMRELCGTRWSMLGGGVGDTAEGQWWNDLAGVWGLTSGDGDEHR